MTSRVFLFALLGLLTTTPFAAVSADLSFPEPVGWDEMDETRRQEYRDLWADFSEQRNAAKLTEEEKESLTGSEKRAVRQAKVSQWAEFRELLAGKGFEWQAYRDQEILTEISRARSAEPQAQQAAPTVSEEEAGDEPVAADLGTIVYDDGAITHSFGGGAIIGNRFNTHNAGNPVQLSGTVSSVVGVMVPGPALTDSTAAFVVLGPQTGGGGAIAIYSDATSITGNPSTTTLTFTGFSAQYTGSSFFVLFADFANEYVPAFGSGSNLGQGHHGVVGYTGMMFPNVTDTFNFGNILNGLVRAGGNIVTPIPVELMKFDVEGAPEKK